MKNVIVASGNQHKIEEVKNILASIGYRVRSMGEIGQDIDIEENGATFEENALIKARTLSRVTDEIVIADDSGLEVEALDGAPGIYSARYAGQHGDDQANNEKLLKELKDVPMEERGARFYCAIAMVFPQGEEIVVRGECRGIIGKEPKGDNGFGYDPLFYIPELGKTFAQLESAEKNSISHRSRALKRLEMVLQDR